MRLCLPIPMHLGIVGNNFEFLLSDLDLIPITQRFILTFLLFLLFACDSREYDVPEPQELPSPSVETISYQRDIRPILDNKCLACHACFDAPCQLKLENAAGLMRGAHPLSVYDGARKESQSPTRLLFDADTDEGWRELGFFSIFSEDQSQISLLENMLSLAKKYPFPENSKLPDGIALGLSRDNQCVVANEFENYAINHALEGMPFAVAGLSDDEYAKMIAWINQGAKVDVIDDELSTTESQHVLNWERYLNQTSLEQQLLSRWLYEHLFLAHLYFDETSNRFFELVRSYTPSGEAIRIVNTRLPNDDPEADFYYRLRPVVGTIVHKRHITLRFDDEMLSTIKTLFNEEAWSVTTLPDYDYAARSNPFVTFNDLPARARYQFMLNHAEYFTRTFIRGPVCRGQIATDVIRDHFWVFYQDPDHDLFVTDAGYREAVTPLLGLPGQNDSLIEMGANWEKYRTKRNEYQTRRDLAYGQYTGLSTLEAVWHGNGDNQNALLTVFRNFDSASVKKGWIGRVPETFWWKDYPLLERSYYELVVNFDVFGNVAHQLQTRLYFDLIRNGAEHNYLRLLPPTERQPLMDKWYDGLGKLKSHITYADLDVVSDSGMTYQSQSPQVELAIQLLDSLADVNALASDKINRCQHDCFREEQAKWIQESDQILSGIAAIEAKQLPGIRHLPENILLRVTHQDERTVYSITRDRAHSNVAFMLGESLRHQPEKDYLTIFPGIIGSYPNFMFSVPHDELVSFTQQLAHAESEETFEAIIVKWGIRRTHPEFWNVLHDFTAWHREHEPLEAGIFDINRYENL